MTLSTGFDTALFDGPLHARARKREELRRQVLAVTKERLHAYFANKKVDSVYITGSLLVPGRFYDFSDIDIGVDGLREPYFRILGELEELLDRPVDIIELEQCLNHETIRAQGIKIR